MTNELKTKTWKDCYGETRTTTFMLIKKTYRDNHPGRPGGPANQWAILIVAEDGWDAKINEWGSYSKRNSGQPAYIQKIWNTL